MHKHKRIKPAVHFYNYVTSFWSCFNDLHEDSEPYMKIACFWWGMLIKT